MGNHAIDLTQLERGPLTASCHFFLPICTASERNRCATTAWLAGYGYQSIPSALRKSRIRCIFTEPSESHRTPMADRALRTNERRIAGIS